MRVHFSHGKVIKNGFKCPWCDCMRTGRIIRDRHLFRIKMECGHVRANAGLTQPYEELERKGLINPDYEQDPRTTAKIKKMRSDLAHKREHEQQRQYAVTTFASGRLLI